MTSRYRCDALTTWAMKPLTLGAGHLWVLMSLWRMDVKWYMKHFIYHFTFVSSNEPVKNGCEVIDETFHIPLYIHSFHISLHIHSSDVSDFKCFIYHFTSILHGLIRTHKWPAHIVSSFIAQLVRVSHRYREVTGSNPVEVLTFSGFYTLKLRS